MEKRGDIMRRMTFNNPVFIPGVNFTVRLGDKWGDLKLGEIIELNGSPESRPIGLGDVVRVYRCDLYHVPDDVVELWHDPKCRTRGGLFDEMRNVYGKEIVDAGGGCELGANVTCVGFVPYLDLRSDVIQEMLRSLHEARSRIGGLTAQLAKLRKD
jgi:hypothetical protein